MVAKADCELPRRAVRGDVVTFTHDFARRTGAHDPLAQDYTQTQEVVRGVPSNIVVHRIRTDILWEDVVSNAGLPVRQFHNGLSFFSSLLCFLLVTVQSSMLTPFQSRTRKLMP